MTAVSLNNPIISQSNNKYSAPLWLSCEGKNQLLKNMLFNGLENKTIENVKIYIINELKSISKIFENNKNKSLLDSEINKNLLNLFKNRNTGCKAQNITRTAAKYVEVLRQLLNAIDPLILKEQLEPQEIQNINLIRNESDRWFRANYIRNVAVTIIKNNIINIQLGRQDGSMGYFWKLEPINIKCKEEPQNTIKYSKSIHLPILPKINMNKFENNYWKEFLMKITWKNIYVKDVIKIYNKFLDDLSKNNIQSPTLDELMNAFNNANTTFMESGCNGINYNMLSNQLNTLDLKHSKYSNKIQQLNILKKAVYNNIQS